MTHDDVLPIIVAALAGDTEQVIASSRQLADQQLAAGNQRAANRIYRAIGDPAPEAAPVALDSQQPQCPGCKLDLRGRCQCPAAGSPAPETGLAPLVATAATPATVATKPPAYCPFSLEERQQCTNSKCIKACDALLGDIGQ